MDSKVDGLMVRAWWAWFWSLGYSMSTQELGRQGAVGFDYTHQLPAQVKDAPTAN
jgi:hypothetical protein